jgi:hypothetical protein
MKTMVFRKLMLEATLILTLMMLKSYYEHIKVIVKIY